MNTGIGDAINLAWKLAAVLRGQAPDSRLDSYEAERIVFARRLVRTTDAAFSFVTAEGSCPTLCVRESAAGSAFGNESSRRAGIHVPNGFTDDT
jgi:2-polyprenyl-6-methoxyphenol hydroxylase-like FAD-dependent oxidoreductase